jgi:Tol biopolymer transport system component
MKADRLVAVQVDAGSGWPPFSAPTLVTGLVSTTTYVHGPTLPVDELEIFFSSDTGSGPDIWTGTRSSSSAVWNPAVLVSELSGSGTDIDPDISSDGTTLYFSSDRAGPSGSNRLYVSRRLAKGQPWGPPQAMLGLGTSTSDTGPSVDTQGLFMVFASLRGGYSDIRLFTASRMAPLESWETVAELTGVNSGMQDENPALFNQALSLVWNSRRTVNSQTSDLFQLSRSSTAVPFAGSPISLDPVNTSQHWEGEPWVSQDGHHLMFVSDRNANISQIFEAWR